MQISLINLFKYIFKIENSFQIHYLKKFRKHVNKSIHV